MKPKGLLLGILSVGVIGTSVVVSPPVPTVAAQYSSEEQTNIDVYQVASPAVVTIKVGRGSGSGSIVSPEGLILTNDHVVRGARNGRVTVIATTGKNYVGDVIATDRPNDLALVRLRTTDRFPTVRLANPSGIQVGQRVYAIGSPFGLSGTLTTGILSRIAENGDLQTDAAINPGNSGGPLLNSSGELIGVNKAILSPNRGGNIGIGFATSATIARNFIEQNRLRTVPDSQTAQQRSSTGRSSIPQQRSSPPRLGVALDSRNFMIQAVEPGSLADEIGLRAGDRLLGVNGRRLRRVEQLTAFLDTRPSSAVLTVSRGRRVAHVRVNF